MFKKIIVFGGIGLVSLSSYAANRSIDITVPNQVNNYDLINGGVFENGLTIFNQRVDSDLVKTDVSSFLPSGEVKRSQHEVSAGNLADGYILIPGDETLDFELKVQKVDSFGEPIAGQFITPFQKTTTISFLPLVKGFISDVPNVNQTGLDIQLPLDESSSLYGILDTQAGSSFLPSGVDLVLKAFLGGNIYLESADLQNGNEATVRTLSGYNSGLSRDVKQKNTKPKLSEFGVLTDADLVLTSLIKYTLGGKNIVHPGGNLGSSLESTPFFDLTASEITAATTVGYNNTSLVSALVAGVDVEGKILGDNVLYNGTDNFSNAGTMSEKDFREKIFKNAYSLLRGIASESIPSNNRLTLTNIDFGTKPVQYFKFDDSATNDGLLTLDLGSNNVSGVGTLIVENANILIRSDLNYQNDISDSLGVIMINSEASSSTNHDLGNLFIHQDVKKFVGTYFVENSLITTGAILPSITNSGLDVSMLNQLMLTGTILSKNTLGGSIVELDDGNPGKYLTPWSRTDDVTFARLYDLHKFRKYSGNDDIAHCVLTGGVCDTNKHAFVIRPDNKVQNISPPGFKF